MSKTVQLLAEKARMQCLPWPEWALPIEELLAQQPTERMNLHCCIAIFVVSWPGECILLPFLAGWMS